MNGRHITVGIGGALGHDANVALVIDGQLIASAQEERYSRRKHDADFPHLALADCLAMGGVRAEDVDACVLAEKTFQAALFDASRRSSNWLSLTAGRVAARLSLNIGPRRFMAVAAQTFPKAKIRHAWHHLSHVAGAFYTSPCERAAFLCVDGKGEDVNASFGVIDAQRIEILGEQKGEAGLGLFYTLITNYLGFASFGSEYKVMGLAPYGGPRFVDALTTLLHLDPNGGVQLRRPLRFAGGELLQAKEWVAQATGVPPRAASEPVGQVHADIAASLQAIFETAILAMARHVRQVTGEKHLLFAGGCAQNCVSAGKLRAAGIFDEIYNSPVGGDMGTALGAALLDQRERGVLKGTRVGDNGYYLGGLPGPVPAEASEFEVAFDGDIFDFAAQRLASGEIIAWCRGRMELGARALGARSILADARPEGMQSKLNLAVKFRESFRPFAPIILEEDVGDWFDSAKPSRYMQFVANLRPEKRLPESGVGGSMRERLDRPRAEIQSVVHVDYSARLQTIAAETHPDMHRLLSKFKALTGVPLLINTSFNVSGEPIVRTAQDAWQCFIHTDVDLLVIENRVFRNPSRLTREEKIAWVGRFASLA